MTKKAIYILFIGLLAVSVGCSKKKAEEVTGQQDEVVEVEISEEVTSEKSPLPEGGEGRYFSIRAEDVHEYMANGAEVIDVRNPEELQDKALGFIPGAMNIPASSLTAYLDELDEESAYILVCRSGNRSRKAARTMVKYGFKYIYNLEGGMQAYRQEFPIQPDLDIQRDDRMPAAPSAPGWR